MPDLLDELLDAALTEAASRSSDSAADAAAVRVLAEAGGFMILDELLAAGAGRSAIARLCMPPDDKRARAKARLGYCPTGRGSTVPVVWLTSTGWQSSGRSSGREVPPDGASVAHAAAPAALARWLAERSSAMDQIGVRVRVASGRAAMSRLSAEAVARAWSELRTKADPDGTVGSVTGGWLPDCVAVESWPAGEAGWRLFQSAWGRPPAGEDDLAETTTAIEFEDSRKSGEPLRSKVARADAVMRIGVCQAVVWVVSSREVFASLRALGVGDEARRPGQLLVPSHLVDLGGDRALPPCGRTWWPLTAPHRLD